MTTTNINTGVNSLSDLKIPACYTENAQRLACFASQMIERYAANIQRLMERGIYNGVVMEHHRAKLQQYKAIAAAPGLYVSETKTTTPETETDMNTTDDVTITINKDDCNLYTAKANGVPVGSVNGWFNNTFAACYAVGIKQRKALAMPELNHEDNAAHNFMSETNAVLWLGDMLVRYFQSNGVNANVVKA